MPLNSEVRAKKSGDRWQGLYRFGGYWWPLKVGRRVRTFSTAAVARSEAQYVLNSMYSVREGK